MRLFALVLLFVLFPAGGWAGGAYEAARSRRVKEAVSYIGQAEYYVRQAVRALKMSEQAGRAPFFDYSRARRDMASMLGEFDRYLRGSGSPAAEQGVAVEVDGRYFARSVRDFLIKKQKERFKVAREREASRPRRGAVSSTSREGVGEEAGLPRPSALPPLPDGEKIKKLIESGL